MNTLKGKHKTVVSISSNEFTAGFTLVELLISLFLSSLLLLGLVQIFSSSQAGIQSQNELSKIQDSARVALEFLSRDIKGSDFTGCLSDKAEIENLLLPIAGFDEDIHQYYSLGGIGAYIADGSDELGSQTIKSGTEVLRIVGSEPVCGSGYELAENTDTLAPLILRNDCNIKDGTVLLVANCRIGNIFVKTGGEGNVVEHTVNSIEGLQNRQNRLTSVFGADASLMKPHVRTYFISEGVTGGDALFLREDGRNFELTSNVSNLYFLFGLDTDLNGSPDDFIRTDQLPSVDSRSIVSIKIELTATSDAGDISRNYIYSVNIRNRMVPAYTLSISNAN